MLINWVEIAWMQLKTDRSSFKQSSTKFIDDMKVIAWDQRKKKNQLNEDLQNFYSSLESHSSQRWRMKYR